MRKFDEASRARKKSRIQLPFNPDELSMERLLELETLVGLSLKDGYLPCPAAWKIARQAGVSRLAVGEVADRMGIRISDCQIGFFCREKTAYSDSGNIGVDIQVIEELKNQDKINQLTCAKVFDISREFRLKPLNISHQAGALGLKIQKCQLGCF